MKLSDLERRTAIEACNLLIADETYPESMRRAVLKWRLLVEGAERDDAKSFREQLERLLDAVWHIANRHGVTCNCDICAEIQRSRRLLAEVHSGEDSSSR